MGWFKGKKFLNFVLEKPVQPLIEVRFTFFQFFLILLKSLIKIKIRCQDIRQGRINCHISLSMKHSLRCNVPRQRSPHLNKTETSSTLIQVTCRSNDRDETLYKLLTRVFSFQSTCLITKSINEALFL